MHVETKLRIQITIGKMIWDLHSIIYKPFLSCVISPLLHSIVLDQKVFNSKFKKMHVKNLKGGSKNAQVLKSKLKILLSLPQLSMNSNACNTYFFAGNIPVSICDVVLMG